jgi:hypothetical protein
MTIHPVNYFLMAILSFQVVSFARSVWLKFRAARKGARILAELSDAPPVTAESYAELGDIASLDFLECFQTGVEEVHRLWENNPDGPRCSLEELQSALAGARCVIGAQAGDFAIYATCKYAERLSPEEAAEILELTARLDAHPAYRKFNEVQDEVVTRGGRICNDVLTGTIYALTDYEPLEEETIMH